MLKDGNYYPTDEDRAVFKRIINAVRLNPDWFASPAAALDRDYSTQAIRDRRAAELREHRSIPNHIKRSRAYERKHCQHETLSQQLGFTVTPLEVIPRPPKRLKGADGKPQQPDIELRKRFAYAFQDAFEVEIDLDVFELQAGFDIAARRVLLAWLRREANRGTVRRITEFQELRDKQTEDGIGPLWIPDEAELQNWDKSRFIRQDGGIEQDAPAWIKKARDAIDFLESLFNTAGLSFAKGNNLRNADASTPLQFNLPDRISALTEVRERAKKNDDLFPDEPHQSGKLPIPLSVVADEIIRIAADVRVLYATMPSLGRKSDSEEVQQRNKQSHAKHFQDLIDTPDFLVYLCESLLEVVGRGHGTAIRELVKRHTTAHGQGYNPFDDDLLATVIEEAQAIRQVQPIPQVEDKPSKGMTQAEAAKAAKKIVESEGWVAIKTLAKRVGTTATTMRKAIKGSPYLAARRAEHDKEKERNRKPREAGTGGKQPEPASESTELDRLIAEQEADKKRDQRRPTRKQVDWG